MYFELRLLDVNCIRRFLKPPLLRPPLQSSPIQGYPKTQWAQPAELTVPSSLKTADAGAALATH
jgi:hypothetical protein